MSSSLEIHAGTLETGLWSNNHDRTSHYNVYSADFNLDSTRPASISAENLL